MFFEKIHVFLQSLLPAILRSESQVLPQTRLYQLITVCQPDSVNEVELLIQSYIYSHHQQHIRPAGRLANKNELTQLAFDIECHVSEKHCLHQLVGRLGMQKDVRSVYWTSTS